MRGNRSGHGFYKWLTVAQYIALGGSSALSFCSKADPANWPALIQGFIQIGKDHAWWAVPAAAAVLVLAQGCKKLSGSPRDWDDIHDLLEQFRQQVFPNADPAYHQRVTLFRRCKFRLCLRCWPWSGWLVPVERSGHLTRKSKALFRASDDGDNAQGVAGQTWAQNKKLYVSALPNLHRHSTDKEVGKYANETWVGQSWVRRQIKRNKILGRSFYGIPVEIKGEVWGVIVLDSRKEKMMDKGEIDDFYEQNARFLAKLLERV